MLSILNKSSCKFTSKYKRACFRIKRIKTWALPAGFFDGAFIIKPDETILSAFFQDKNWHKGINIKFQDVNRNKELSNTKTYPESELQNIYFSPNGQNAAIHIMKERNKRNVGDYESIIILWNVIAGYEISRFSSYPELFYGIKFSPDGRFLATGGRAGSIKLWDSNSGAELRSFRSYISPVLHVCFSPDGKKLAIGREGLSKEKSIQIWDTANICQLRSLMGHSDNVYTLAFSPDGSKLASGSRDFSIKLWDPETGKNLKTLRCGDDEVFSIAFSDDGKFIASGGALNGGISIWDGSTGKKIPKIAPGSRAVHDIAFSPNSHILAAALDNYDNSAMPIPLWDVNADKSLRDLRGHTSAIYSISFSPDGKILASSSSDETVKLWQVETGNEIRTFSSKPGTLKISPDGKRLALGSIDNSIKLWDIHAGKEIKTLRGHSKSVSSIAFSPDGQTLASGSLDGTTKIWNTKTFEHITIVSAGDEWVTYCSTGREGYYNSSLEASPLVTWVFSGTPSEEIFSFEQFESVFKRPDIIKKWLAATSFWEKPTTQITRPPFVDLSEHKTIKQTSQKAFPLKLTTSAADKVKELRIFVNGKSLQEISVNAKEKELSISVPLLPGANRITAVAYNEKGFSSNPKYVDVICNRTDLPKPNLYALGIGVSKYSRLPREWQLSYAHTDARAVVEAFKKQEGGLFGQVKTKLLTNQEANVAAISDVLESLAGMSENDIAVIFLAGHGIMGKDGTFYYLTSEGSMENPEKGGLSWKVLNEYLAKIKGRVIMLLDACHSGNISTETVVPNNELAHKLSSEGRSGVMVFAASKGRQSALESPDLGGGFGTFAYAVTQTLGPKAKQADLNDNGFIEFMEMVEYVGRSVDKETEGEQTPWLSRKELFGDLAIASVSGSGEKKPGTIPQLPFISKETTPGSASVASQHVLPTESLNLIRSTVQSFYASVQNKNVDQAISYYATSKRPNIKRSVLESVAKDTQSYRIERIDSVEVGSTSAKVMVYLFHKKLNKPEEYWEITVDLVNEDGNWRMLNTPGKKVR